MSKKVLIIGILVLVFLTGCGHNYGLKEISFNKYQTLISEKESFIIYFGRKTCTACESFYPNISEVATNYKVKVYYIDLDKISESDGLKLDKMINISGTPTTVFITSGEEESTLNRINSSVSIDRIIEKFKTNGYIKE